MSDVDLQSQPQTTFADASKENDRSRNASLEASPGQANWRCAVLPAKNVGNYIVDFFCAKANLAIEIDGGQHYSDEGILRDAERDRYLQAQGLQVLRFSDRDVFTNPEGILQQILAQIARKDGEAS